MPDDSSGGLVAWWRHGGQVDPDSIYRHLQSGWHRPGDVWSVRQYYNDMPWFDSVVAFVGRPGALVWNALASNPITRWLIPILIAAFVVDLVKKFARFLGGGAAEKVDRGEPSDRHD